MESFKDVFLEMSSCYLERTKYNDLYVQKRQRENHWLYVTFKK